MYKLTMISGVAESNDMILGYFPHDRTAFLVAEFIMMLDRFDCPEYESYTIEPVEDFNHV